MFRSLLFVVFLIACGPTAPEVQSLRAEFSAIADRLEAGSNTYLGHAQLIELEGMFESEENPMTRAILQGKIAKHLLRLGRVEAAIQAADAAWLAADTIANDAGEIPAPPNELRTIKIIRAQTYLRKSEVENCIARHNRDCCIFPLEAGGVHDDETPARQSLAIYLELAAEEPNNLKHRWMCNLLAMALADHPDALPPEVVIPMAAFDSEYDLGRFPDIAAAVGTDVFSLCGGSAIEDYDGDGYLDIAVSNFDPRGALVLLRNDGSGAFEDRSSAANIADQFGGLNLIAADYDSDGDADLLALRGAWLLNEGLIRNSLLRNDGHGVFTDVTKAAGLEMPMCPTQTAAFGDFDNDGNLDLFVGNEAIREEDRSHRGLPSQLFMNDGDGSFTVSDEATNERYCKGAAVGDYDNDGDQDLYLSNIGAHADLGVNRLYRNNGQAEFDDVASELGVDGPAWSFATWFFDYDNDGELDLFVGGYEATMEDVAADYAGLPETATRPRLYHNNNGTFEDRAVSMGLDRPFLPMGANFGDFDNDGWLDIYLTTGSPPYDFLMPNIALRNDEGRRFQDVTRAAGLGHLQKGHGVTFADLDNDGDQDIHHELGGFMPGDAFSNALFENPGHGNRFLQIQIVGTTSNRAGVGTRVRVIVESDGKQREIHRAVGSVSSFGGSPRRLEIGLASAERIVSLGLLWPTSKTRQLFEQDLPLDGLIEITEGADEFKVLERKPLVFGAQ